MIRPLPRAARLGSAALGLLAAMTVAHAGDGPGPAPAARPAPPQDLLRNGGFEAPKAGPPDGWELAAGRLADESEAVPAHGGRRSVTLVGTSAAGASLRQRLEKPPRGRGLVRLSGWVRLDAPPGGHAPEASLAFVCLGADDPAAPSAPGARPLDDLAGSARVYRGPPARPGDAAAGAWVRFELTAPAPASSAAWLVCCEVAGPGRAAFDDLSLTLETGPASLVGATLALATGSYLVDTPRGGARAPWIEFSVPVPHGDARNGEQVPLFTRVVSDPPGRIARVERAPRDPQGEDGPLRVTLEDLRAGELVRLRAETLVLVSDREPPDGRGVPLAAAPDPGDPPAVRERALARVPADVRPFLADAPGIERDSAGARAAAAKLRGRDLADLTADLATLLEYKLGYSADGTDRADRDRHTLMAQSAAWANAAASVLLARGVPARLVACLPVGGALQEHYLLEVWTPVLGWARLDPAHGFPVAPTRHVILRVVRPDDARSAQNVPVFVRGSEDVVATFDMNPVTLFWQSCTPKGCFAAQADALADTLASSRTGWRDARPAGPAGADAAGGSVLVRWLPVEALSALRVAGADGLAAAIEAQATGRP